MGWLSSLVTKVVPKVWKAGVQTTSSLWRAGSSVVGAGNKVVSAVSHNPKTAAVVGVTTYAGWKSSEPTTPWERLWERPFVKV